MLTQRSYVIIFCFRINLIKQRLTCVSRGDSDCGCENDSILAGECGDSLAAADTCWPLLKLFTMGLQEKGPM